MAKRLSRLPDNWHMKNINDFAKIFKFFFLFWGGMGVVEGGLLREWLVCFAKS